MFSHEIVIGCPRGYYSLGEENIESNTGKSARQGNLRHPRVRFQSLADKATLGCRKFPCLAFFAGVWFYFSLLSAVFSFVFVWQLYTFSRRSCKQCELFPLHVNQKSFLCIALRLLCNNIADCWDLRVYKRFKTYIQWIVYFKKEKHGESGGSWHKLYHMHLLVKRMWFFVLH